jgi:hypothetical protein
MGRGAAEETGDTLQVLAGVLMELLSLDMMMIIVVVAEAFFAKVGVLKGMLVSWMTVVTGDENMKLVGGIGVRAEKAD